jgi:hypothetical protein
MLDVAQSAAAASRNRALVGAAIATAAAPKNGVERAAREFGHALRLGSLEDRHGREERKENERAQPGGDEPHQEQHQYDHPPLRSSVRV